MPEQANEKHNRIATDIAMTIHNEFPDPIDQLIVLESITAAVIGTMGFKKEIKLHASIESAKILHEGVEGRLRERISK